MVTTNKYYYCQRDVNGQKTGYVKTIELSESDIEYDFHIKKRANKTYKGLFLFENKSECELAALS